MREGTMGCGVCIEQINDMLDDAMAMIARWV